MSGLLPRAASRVWQSCIAGYIRHQVARIASQTTNQPPTYWITGRPHIDNGSNTRVLFHLGRYNAQDGASPR